MNNDKKVEDRDEVLFAFHQASINPTAEEIIAWVTRYPQFADDIRGHAAILKDWAAREGQSVEEPNESMLSRGRSRALDALYNAEIAQTMKESSTAASSFEQIMAARNTDIPALARKLDITRGILAALVNGRMLAPVGKRLMVALTSALGITQDEFDTAFQSALGTPRVGHAKAVGSPTLIPKDYADLIRSSTMSEERKGYWLSED